MQSLLTKLVMGTDPGRQMNLKITLSAQPAYLANLALIWYCVHNGFMDPELYWPISLSVLAAMAFFYVTIRFGWSRGLRDPAMTVPQMMAASLLCDVGYVVAPQVHILLLMPVAVTMAYSVFALKGRAVLFMQLFNMAVFSLTSIVMCYREPQYYKPEVEILVLGILATTVVVLTWSGSQIAELRARHRRQREELTQTLARIADLATRDALTGLSNRRHMNTLLAHHMERTRRFGPPLTLAMVDLDHFKGVNDTHGHAVGDDVLQTFARVALNALRGSDTLARWGGEEFLLMSTASEQEVLALLEQVRAQLADTPASAQVPTLRVSFSAGIATHHAGEGVTDTIHRADEALYAAKTAGRAQSRLAPEAKPQSVKPGAALAAKEAATSNDVTGTAKGLDTAAPDSKMAGAKHSRAAAGGLPAMPAPPVPPAGMALGRLAWLLGRDEQLRGMLQRTLMGYVPYLAGLIILGYAAHMELMSLGTTQSLALGLFLTPVLMFAAVRGGLTRNLKDPALTLAQILLATTWTAVMYASTLELHSAQLMTLVMVMTIGVCNLSTRQAMIICVYAMAIMSLVILAMTRLQPQVYVPAVELANWLLVVCDLPVLMLMGTQLGKLRGRLKIQRLQLKDAVAQLSELATRDELTGLNNRGHMKDLLAHYARRHAQCKEVFSLALIDLDHFKRINDQYGHAVGDEVLRAFAQQATKTMRTIDVIARWGGEEFLVLCAHSEPEKALVGLERLRHAFENLQVSVSVPELRASFSVGLTAPGTGESIETTLGRADQALYEAKRAGRNRIHRS